MLLVDIPRNTKSEEGPSTSASKSEQSILLRFLLKDFDSQSLSFAGSGLCEFWDGSILESYSPRFSVRVKVTLTFQIRAGLLGEDYRVRFRVGV